MSLKILYTIAMPKPETHRFFVTLKVENWRLDASLAEFVLPAWTPGSYLVREFARHVENFRAETLDGTALPWQRTSKGSWRVETAGERDFQILYEVYANDLTVRTSHLDESHGYFNGTNVFMYLDGFKEHPVFLSIQVPEGWHCSIALPQNDEGLFEAKTYDVLVDSPAEIGRHRLLTFNAVGKPHEIALWGRGNEDESALRQDMKKIVETVAEMFYHELPYDRYLFIVHLGDRLSGGLEHLNSTTLAVDRWTFSPRRDYEKFLRLTAHEYFHTWNVKRLRPSNLGPFDYTKEVYTPLLWVMEGFTSYYDNLFMRRAGFITPQRYLELMAERIAKYRLQPGRLVQSLEESSLTTWIKFYRQDENYMNTGISYYLKGSLVALMLDLHLRYISNNEKSLDDVMRYLWHIYGSRDIGFTPDQFYDAVEGVGEMDLDPYLERYVSGVEELPLEQYFTLAGLELISGYKSDTPMRWMGLRLRNTASGVRIKNVLRDSPAEAAGLIPNDRLIAIDGYEIQDVAFVNARLHEKKATEKVTFHLFRYGLLIEKDVTLTQPPYDQLILRPRKDTTIQQRNLLENWLHTTWTTINSR